MIALPSIPAFDTTLARELRARIDGLAKPPGALGRMEDLAVQLGLIQNTLQPQAARALLMIFAGDHGLTEDGVSRYPAAVTGAMVSTFLAGKASASAFAAAVDAEVRVVDAGVAAAIDHPKLLQQNVRRGTANAARAPAMSIKEAETALARGIALAQTSAQEFDILACGEMGIGNSASAALLMHRLADVSLAQCVGRGAGHDDAGLAHKLAVLERAAARTNVRAPLDVLAEFGGCEIAMMAGAILGAASARRVMIVDGFISSAAALVAVRLAPAVFPFCVFSHRSAEAGHRLLLDALGAKPLLDLDMRLGEGTGALLAVPLLRAAANLLSHVASLDDVLQGRL